MPKKLIKRGKATVHKELDGFNIRINEFGQMETNVSIDKLNTFLNDKVDDKKLSNEEEE